MNILEWIEQYKNELSDSASHKTYRAALPALATYFEKMERPDLQVEDVTAYRRWLEQEGEPKYSQQTIRLYVTVFRQFLKWAVARGLLNGDFYFQMSAYYDTMSSKRQTFVRRYIDPDDVKKLLEAMEKLPEKPELSFVRDRALLFLLAGTGLRVSEALSLNREPFDAFFGNWNHRREMVISVVGKGDKPRDVVILPSALRKVSNYLSMRKDLYPALFISHGNRHTKDRRITRKTAWLSIAAEAEKLGLESFLAPHAMRHYFLDSLADKIDLRTLSDIAGHADVRMTDRTYLGPVRTKQLVKAVREAKGD